MAGKDLPAKLNEIDRFLRTRQTEGKVGEGEDEGEGQVGGEQKGEGEADGRGAKGQGAPARTPDELVAEAVAPTKLAVLRQLQEQASEAEERNEKRRAAVTARREALKRRCGHIADMQRLYDAAMAQILSSGTGDCLERLVDRMAHQAIPASTKSSPAV